jgi:2-keto-3-deoxy-L-rhamnonate aldolase
MILIQLEEASQAGAQWGMVLAPGYFAPLVNQEGVASWYEAIAAQSLIPIMIYHYPGISNNINIAPSAFVQLAQNKNIVGCKLSHTDLSHHSQIAGNPSLSGQQFAVFTGLGQQLLSVLSVGGIGAIDGLAGIFPRVVVRLFDLYMKWDESKDDREELKRLQFEIAAGEEVIVKYGTVGVKEGVAKALEMGNGKGTRLPMFGGMPEGAWADLRTPLNDWQEPRRR